MPLPSYCTAVNCLCILTKIVSPSNLSCMQDIANVRDAMLGAVGSAWQGARDATVEVMNYQYGPQVRELR